MSEEYFYKKRRDPAVMKYFEKEMLDAWGDFNSKVFKEGAIPKKFKELIAVACAYNTRCPWCIESHARAALKAGATKEEIGETIAIAAALSAGAVMAHRTLALEVKEE